MYWVRDLTESPSGEFVKYLIHMLRSLEFIRKAMVSIKSL